MVGRHKEQRDAPAKPGKAPYVACHWLLVIAIRGLQDVSPVYALMAEPSLTREFCVPRMASMGIWFS